jgi:hypothetical protein
MAMRKRREYERHHLAAHVRSVWGARPPPPALADRPLQPQPPGERRDRHDNSVQHRALILEHGSRPVQSNRLVIVHHESDLLTHDPATLSDRFPPGLGGI